MMRPAFGRSLRSSAPTCNTEARDVPLFNARSLARCITGPSATGSLNGAPSSITSAPASIRASATSRVVSRSGSPQVRYATRPGLCVNAIISELELLRQNAHVLIAPPRDVDDDNVILFHPRHAADALGNRMCRFKCRHDTFSPRQGDASIERLSIGYRH